MQSIGGHGGLQKTHLLEKGLGIRNPVGIGISRVECKNRMSSITFQKTLQASRGILLSR